MMEIIQLAVLTSLFIFGWTYATSFTPEGSTPENPYGDVPPVERQIAWAFRYYIGRFVSLRLPSMSWVLKPLLFCNQCMASVYGSISYLAYFQLDVRHLLIWPVFVVIVCGLNRIISQIAEI